MTIRIATICLFGAVCVAASIAACETSEGGDGNEGEGSGAEGNSSSAEVSSADGGSADAGDGEAPSADIERCKDSCNQLKFFDCNDSAQHSACFTACEAASADDIEVFVACVQTDICDPTCIENLVETADPDPPNPDACVGACTAIIEAGCYPADPGICASFCGTLTNDERAFLVYCDFRREGCEFPAECEALFGEGGEETGGGGEEGGVTLDGGGGEVTGGG